MQPKIPRNDEHLMELLQESLQPSQLEESRDEQHVDCAHEAFQEAAWHLRKLLEPRDRDDVLAAEAEKALEKVLQLDFRMRCAWRKFRRSQG